MVACGVTHLFGMDKAEGLHTELNRPEPLWPMASRVWVGRLDQLKNWFIVRRSRQTWWILTTEPWLDRFAVKVSVSLIQRRSCLLFSGSYLRAAKGGFFPISQLR